MIGFLSKAIQSGTFIPEIHSMLMPELVRNTMKERERGGSHKELAEIALNYFGTYENINIEQLATFLVSDTTPYEAKEPRDRAYEQLLLIITNTLKNVYANPHSKEILSFYSEFAQALVDLEIPVISFNYDLLLG